MLMKILILLSLLSSHNVKIEQRPLHLTGTMTLPEDVQFALSQSAQVMTRVNEKILQVKLTII